MKRAGVVVSAALVLMAASAGAAGEEEVSWTDVGRGTTDVGAVLVSDSKPLTMYCANPTGVYKSRDPQKPWQMVLTFASAGTQVNALVFGAQTQETVYAASSTGLFQSTDAGQTWNRVFSPRSARAAGCTAVAESGSMVFAGTAHGLYYSEYGCRHWVKVKGALGTAVISALAGHPQQNGTLFAVAHNCLWRTADSGSSWDKVFSAPRQEDLEEEAEEPLEDLETEDLSFIRSIAVDPAEPDTLYLGTRQGVLCSKDNAGTWELVPQQGLWERDVSLVKVFADRRVCAVAGKRIFVYDDRRWHELSRRLACADIRGLAIGAGRTMYVACELGLYTATAPDPGSFTATYDQPTSAQEPTVSQVQQAAIRYAEVEPEKISQWRRQAARRAWLPELSVGLNNDITDYRHWEGGSTAKESDDLLRKGKQSVEWDLSVQWDLGDLIWTDDQTSIDARSRLMVELRNDIVDQVTKLYFERLKVKAELEGLAITEKSKRADRELRLNELTAYLDGLTGGYVSEYTAGK